MAPGVLTEAAAARACRTMSPSWASATLHYAARTVPSLSTVSINGMAIGRLAAQRLPDRFNGVVCFVSKRVTDMGFALLQRGST